jgi:hypothetical protein
MLLKDLHDGQVLFLIVSVRPTRKNALKQGLYPFRKCLIFSPDICFFEATISFDRASDKGETAKGITKMS